MIRGTTPTHTFDLPFDESVIDKIRIIYSQNEKSIFKKETDDCEISGNTVKVLLSQEDTLKLKCHFPVEIFVRVVTTDGKALVSDPETDSVFDCGENEVL